MPPAGFERPTEDVRGSVYRTAAILKSHAYCLEMYALESLPLIYAQPQVLCNLPKQPLSCLTDYLIVRVLVTLDPELV